MRLKIKTKSFTLVELIIVIAVIAILSVITFMVIGKWIERSRNSRRYGDVSKIGKALDIFYIDNNHYPEPSDFVEIRDVSGSLVAYQGVFDDDVINQGTSINKLVRDPKDSDEYAYTKLISPAIGYEVGCLLENEEKVAYMGLTDQTYASKIRSPYIVRKSNIGVCQLGIVEFPSILSMLNKKEGKFLRLENAVSGAGTGVIVTIDLNNLTGTCDGEITAGIVRVVGDNLNISTGDLEYAFPDETFTEKGIYVEFVNPDNETITCTGCVAY